MREEIKKDPEQLQAEYLGFDIVDALPDTLGEAVELFGMNSLQPPPVAYFAFATPSRTRSPQWCCG